MTPAAASAIMLVLVVVFAEVGRRLGERLGDRARLREQVMISQGVLSPSAETLQSLVDLGMIERRFEEKAEEQSPGDRFEDEFQAYQEARGAGEPEDG